MCWGRERNIIWANWCGAGHIFRQVMFIAFPSCVVFKSEECQLYLFFILNKYVLGMVCGQELRKVSHCPVVYSKKESIFVPHFLSWGISFKDMGLFGFWLVVGSVVFNQANKMAVGAPFFFHPCTHDICKFLVLFTSWEMLRQHSLVLTFFQRR